jgi:hypothetical protein
MCQVIRTNANLISMMINGCIGGCHFIRGQDPFDHKVPMDIEEIFFGFGHGLIFLSFVLKIWMGYLIMVNVLG